MKSHYSELCETGRRSRPFTSTFIVIGEVNPNVNFIYWETFVTENVSLSKYIQRTIKTRSV